MQGGVGWLGFFVVVALVWIFALDFCLGFVWVFWCVCFCAFAVLFGIYQLNGEEKSPGETLADSGWRPISNIL